MAENRLRVGTLGEVLSSRRRRCFVGREGELELVRSALDAREPRFSVLWFTGPGGIGKTSLLEAIAELAEAAGGLRVVRLDGRELPSSPRAALDAVREALGVPQGEEAVAAPEGRLVVLLDAYERLGALDEWMRTWQLPRLPASALTVVAGRQLPGPAWRADSAWRELLWVVSLGNLGPEESRSYLRTTRCRRRWCSRWERYACPVATPRSNGSSDCWPASPGGAASTASSSAATSDPRPSGANRRWATSKPMHHTEGQRGGPASWGPLANQRERCADEDGSCVDV